MPPSSAGAGFRAAVAAERPLQVPGAICAYHAILAERSGFKAIYLSGGGVAAGSLGLPDLGISNLDDVLTDVRRITDVCTLPLLVDVDTGFGASAFNIARTVKSLIKFGAGAMHIEDQVGAKRCGHRPGKELVSQQEMVDRIKAAVDARTDADFVVMARTDALAVEGLDAAIARARACVEAGADMIFPEAITDLAMYALRRRGRWRAGPRQHHRARADAAFTVAGACDADVAIALYPLGVPRDEQGGARRLSGCCAASTQKAVVDTMMRETRAELYDYLGYHAYEQKLDAHYAKGKT
jgi:methylisocitrate lyase